MTDKLMDCITNPVKCKLLLEIHSQGKSTAKHLANIYNDIPQATLYRHLKKNAERRHFTGSRRDTSTRYGRKDLFTG